MTDAQAHGGEERYPEAQSATEQWQRVVLYRAVGARLAALDVASLSAAEISGDTHAGRGGEATRASIIRRLTSALRSSGPAPSTWSSANRSWSTSSTLSERHETCGSCALPSGHVIVSTPFLIRVHELPLFAMRDYWRFTPRGLRTLLEQAGLVVDEVGEWGNRECVMHELDHWTAYRPWHSLKGEPDIPVQVWAFARRRD